MSGSGRVRGAPARPSEPPERARVVAATTASALLALALAGHGLLVPAGPPLALVRFGGATIALVAVAALLRRDGPAQGSRTLALVAITGALTGLATLPASPVAVDGSLEPLPETGGEQGRDTVVLDQVGPPGGAPRLVVPPGAVPRLDGGSVVAVGPDGDRTTLGPAEPGTEVAGPDGTVVVVVDGALLERPAPVAPPQPEDGPDPLDDGVEAVLALLLVALALLAFAPPLRRAVDRALAPVPVVDPPAPPAPARTVEAGLADVLRAMLADPDPRTAVIGAYAGLLAALADAGAPRRPEEGPHEHLWRTLGPLGVRRAPVHRLAELFVRARFTPHPITDEHRRAAIAALADAVADLRLGARRSPPRRARAVVRR